MEDKKKEVKEPILTVEQVMNELKISGRNRGNISARHFEKKMSKSEWEKLLKKEGF